MSTGKRAALKKVILHIAIKIAIVWVLFLLGFVQVGSAAAEEPDRLKLMPLIAETWRNDPGLAQYLNRSALSLGKGTVIGVEVKQIEIKSSKVGRFQQSAGIEGVNGPRISKLPESGAELKYGPQITYYPVKTKLKTTYQKELFKSLGQKPQESEETTQETCFAYQETDGSWNVTFTAPKDETPSYKVW